MDLRYSPAELEFQAELRDWLAGVLPSLGPKPHPDDWPGRRAYDTAWQRKLFDAGYAGINWPKAYGGRGATPRPSTLIFLEESERAKAPYVGVELRRPAARRPDADRRGEPGGAGGPTWPTSSRATRSGARASPSPAPAPTSPRCAARRCATATTTWSPGRRSGPRTVRSRTTARCSCAPTPDAPKHKGITWLAMDMQSPGITIRPLRTIVGSTEFAEMFLDEVRIPVSNRVGAENDGWRVTNVTPVVRARHRPSSPTTSTPSRSVAELSELAKKVTRHGATAWEDRALRRELAADRRGARRPVGAHQAQHLRGPAHRPRRLRRLDLQAALLRGPPALGRRRRPGSWPRASLSMEDLDGLPSGRLVEDRPHLAEPVHRGRHVADPAQHHQRAGPRTPARTPVGALTDGLPAHRRPAGPCAKGVREVCADAFPRERLGELAASGDGFDAALWSTLTDLGVFGLRLPEEQGGLGLGLADAALVFQELGRALVPGPLVGTFLAAGIDGVLTGAPVSVLDLSAEEPGRTPARRAPRLPSRHWSCWTATRRG